MARDCGVHCSSRIRLAAWVQCACVLSSFVLSLGGLGSVFGRICV